jgi:capsular polysaccharide biosynthesis protein
VSTQITDRLVLRPNTDELEALPHRSTVADLLEDGSDRGRLELLPGSNVRASSWHPGAVALKGGSYSPPWWSDDPVIESKAAHLFRLRDAYYVPRFGVVISGAGEVMQTSMAQAAYPTPDLSLLPHAERVGDETVLDIPPDLDRLERIVVSMPWGAIYNYGHFLLDCLPTVAAVLEIPELEAYTFAFPSLQPWHRRHLELLGVHGRVELGEGDARWRGSIFQVSDLVFSSAMGHNLYHPNVNYRTVRDRQLARKLSTPFAYEKIYITRRGNPKRVFCSERTLEERLRELGFAIVAPEHHTIDEQIDIFRNADVIVGCAGAAFANVVYCRPDTTVVEITPSGMVTPTMIGGIWVRNICVIVGCRWRPYYCEEEPPDEPTLVAGIERRELGRSFDLDVDDLLGYIESVTATG